MCIRDRAYNLLESYTRHRIDQGAPRAIIYPQDYTLMLSRSAIIPRQAPRADLGARFLDYLLSPRGQDMLARQSGMRPVSASVVPAAGVRPVALGVGLLVYLDPVSYTHLDVYKRQNLPSRTQRQGAQPASIWLSSADRCVPRPVRYRKHRPHH